MGSCHQYSSSSEADEALKLRHPVLPVEAACLLRQQEQQQQQKQQQQEQQQISLELHALQMRNNQGHCRFPSAFRAGLWYGPPHAS